MRPYIPMRAERRWSEARAALLLVLGLAGCAAPPERRSDVPDFGEVKALFALGQDVQVINVRALDRLPISAAVLVLPGGDRIPAYSIDQQKNPSLSDHTRLGAPAGDAFGIGAGVPLLAGPGMPESTTVLIGQIASTALIRVPDMGEYREAWPQAKIEIHMGFPPEERVEFLPAPQPG
jgi:hypothetical protein